MLLKCHYLLYLLHICRTQFIMVQDKCLSCLLCATQGPLPCTQIYNITEVIEDLGTTQGRKVAHFRETVGGISASNEQQASFDLPLIQCINP